MDAFGNPVPRRTIQIKATGGTPETAEAVTDARGRIAVEVVWDLLLPAASGALLLYGGLRVLDGRLSLGDLMMFLVYLAMLLEPLAVLATSVTQLQNNLSGLDRVLDLLEEPREMVSAPGARTVSKGSVGVPGVRWGAA